MTNERMIKNRCVICGRPTLPLNENTDLYVCCGTCAKQILLHTKVVHSEPGEDYLQCGKCHEITSGDKWYSGYYTGWTGHDNFTVLICPMCGGLTFYDDIPQTNKKIRAIVKTNARYEAEFDSELDALNFFQSNWDQKDQVSDCPYEFGFFYNQTKEYKEVKL